MTLTDQERAARNETFGYACRACSRCCAHKIIQVNPYEIARLAEHVGLTTRQFRERFTERGAILKRDADDVCVFRTEKGCGVHPARPLVCRLYPLGRRVSPDGIETWLQIDPHPQSEGVYTNEGTIGDFIAVQGALPYMRAADDYADWVRKACAVIDSGLANPAAPFDADGLLDMDEAITAYCKETGTAEPSGVEERRQMHLAILYRQLEPEEGEQA